MNTKLRWALTLLLTMNTVVFSQTVTDKLAVSLVDEINNHFYLRDDEAMGAMVAKLAAQDLNKLSDADLYCYELAVWRFASNKKNYADVPEKEMIRATDAISKPRHGPYENELRAIRSLMMGLLAGGGGLSPMRYGTASGKEAEAAFKNEPKNPRVLLAISVVKLKTPAMWGGDQDLAITYLKTAVDMGKDAPSPSGLTWGHVDNLFWLGNAYMVTNKLELSKQTFLAALAERPDYKVVKYARLPTIEKKLAAAANKHD